MSEYSPTWCTELYGILIHPSELRVLMLRGAAGWSLPHMSLDQAVWEADVGKVSEAMRLALGAEVTTLRYASYSVSADAHQIDAIYVLESHNPAWEPQDGAEWVGRAALADLPFARPEHRTLVAAHLAEAESGQIPEHRPPWAHVGWFEQAAACGQPTSRSSACSKLERWQSRCVPCTKQSATSTSSQPWRTLLNLNWPRSYLTGCARSCNHWSRQLLAEGSIAPTAPEVAGETTPFHGPT